MIYSPFKPLNHTFEVSPLCIIEHTTFPHKNIGIGSFHIRAILHEFAKASQAIALYKKSLEEIAIRNLREIDDKGVMAKIEQDADYKTMSNINILEIILNNI